MDYLYDGTYEGFLTCVYEHYYIGKTTGIYRQEEYQPDMLSEAMTIQTDPQKAAKVYNAINQKIGMEGARLVYRSFLSDTERKENAILQYLIYGFKMGRKINGLYTHPAVLALRKMEHVVAAEQHRLLGLLRFSELKPPAGDAILYAQLEPDHDVIELMADHFVDRYKNEAFMIHDQKRQKAVFYAKGHWDVRELPRDFKMTAQKNGWLSETTYETLWKNYFHTIAIKARTNPKCQKGFMPARYWKNITEFRQDI